jgi:hypothetical protein
MPKHDEHLGGTSKKYPQIAGVSAHCFDATAIEKAWVFTENTFFFAVSVPVSGLQNYSQ